MKSTLRLTLQPYINHNVNEPYPFVCIRYGNEVVYNGALTTKKTFKYVIDCDSNLVIEHYNKQPSDTTVNENNEITYATIIIRNSLGGTVFLTTILHEIGNVLGLGDISPRQDIRSIQEDPFQEDFVGSSLWEFDVQMIKQLYDE